MTELHSIVIETPDSTVTLTPKPNSKLAVMLDAIREQESEHILDAAYAYLSTMGAHVTTEMDHLLSRASSIITASIASDRLPLALAILSTIRRQVGFNNTVPTSKLSLEEVNEQLRTLPPVPKPVPVPPPGEFVPTIGHELEEE